MWHARAPTPPNGTEVLQPRRRPGGLALAQERITALELTTSLALDAALLARDGIHGDPADRIIAATAISLNAPLVTKDRALRGFAPLATIW